MTKYLISFPSCAMEVAADEWELVSRETHAVAQQAKDAGVWVFGGGINESVAPVRVAGNGSVIEGAYPENERLSGGFAVLDSVPATLQWSGQHASPCAAGARRRCGSSCTTRSREPASRGAQECADAECRRTTRASLRVGPLVRPPRLGPVAIRTAMSESCALELRPSGI